jgi:hypothetical protein
VEKYFWRYLGDGLRKIRKEFSGAIFPTRKKIEFTKNVIFSEFLGHK